VHDAAMQWIAKHATTEPCSVLDVGGRSINGSPRHLFPAAEPYTVLDIRPGPGVDIVADAAAWQPERTWDVVVCAETLEHAARWRDILRTAFVACEPGGRLIVTTAAPGRPPHSAADGEFRLAPGEYYANVRPAELQRVLTEAGWADVVIDVQADPHDVRAVAVRPR
jgi:SAM-dependent methyltransferase